MRDDRLMQNKQSWDTMADSRQKARPVRIRSGRE